MVETKPVALVPHGLTQVPELAYGPNRFGGNMIRVGRLRRSLLALVLVAAFMAWPTSVSAREGSISVSPTSGPVGTQVTVQGNGWSPRASLTLVAEIAGGRYKEYDATADSSGRFSKSFSIPGDWEPSGQSRPMRLYVCFDGDCTGGNHAIQFTITKQQSQPAPVSPPTATPRPTNTPVPPPTATVAPAAAPAKPFVPAPQQIRPGALPAGNRRGREYTGEWQTVEIREDLLHLGAYIYQIAGTPAELRNVRFTYRGGDILCDANSFTPGTENLWECDRTLSDLPPGQVKITYLIYDKSGNPWGGPDEPLIFTIPSAPSVLGAATTEPPAQTDTTLPQPDLGTSPSADPSGQMSSQFTPCGTSFERGCVIDEIPEHTPKPDLPGLDDSFWALVVRPSVSAVPLVGQGFSTTFLLADSNAYLDDAMALQDAYQVIQKTAQVASLDPDGEVCRRWWETTQRFASRRIELQRSTGIGFIGIASKEATGVSGAGGVISLVIRYENLSDPDDYIRTVNAYAAEMAGSLDDDVKGWGCTNTFGTRP